MAVLTSKIVPPDIDGLERERLQRALAEARRVALVIAPAGAGKTTLLAQFARRSADPVAWYRAEQHDRAAGRLLEHLERALAGVLNGLPRGWNDAHAAAEALEHWNGSRAYLIIDDLHTLHGSQSEKTLGQLIEYLPGSIRLIAASRTEPGSGINLQRLCVSGHVTDIGSDDLRFRSWEVEQLFLRVYGATLPPEDLAVLTRRTNGWAAGLQLFHLATTGKPAAERRRLLAALTARASLVRDYLATNVLADLAEELRQFMLDSCVLGSLDGRLCDRLRNTHGSATLLDELKRRQLLTLYIEDGEWYRYHDVLRSHLQAVLLDELGEPEVRRRYRTAGALLEDAGRLNDAAVAYCYAEAWDAVSRVLGGGGADRSHGTATWLDGLPSTAPHDDPWLLLTIARHALLEGRVDEALDAYRRSERSFGAAAMTDVAHHERRAMTSWFDPGTRAPIDWVAALQVAARGTTTDLPAVAGGLMRRLVSGVATMFGGRPAAAVDILRDVADDPEAGQLLAPAASLAAALAALLAGDADADDDVEQAADDCDRVGLSWLAHVGRAALALVRSTAVGEARSVRERCRRFGDRLGEALGGLFVGLGTIADPEPAAQDLADSATVFRQYGLRALETWALAGRALALERIEAPEADTVAAAAESLSRSAGAAGVVQLVLRAPFPALRRDPAPAASNRRDRHAEADDRTQPAPSTCVLRMLGGFSLVAGDRAVDVSRLKPRARSVLYLLAINAGQPVHRDTITETLWPDLEATAAIRSLHVTLSALRRELQGRDGAGHALLERRGNAYVLAAEPGASVDLVNFDRACSASQAAMASGNQDAALAALRRALSCYRGELLPEVGSPEWVLTKRDQVRNAAAWVAEQLATVLLARGDLTGVVQACERGLAIDGFHDGLWRLAATAHERRGDHAAANRVRRSYERVLRDLGIESPEADTRAAT